jgi:hypothetical protein
MRLTGRLRRAIHLALGFVVAALLLSPAAALANAGPTGYAADHYGGTLVPVKHDSIAVLGEHLTIDLSKLSLPLAGDERVPIRATYRIRNESGSPQKALLGFPYWTWRQETDQLQGPGESFRVTLDGRPLETRPAPIALADESAPPGEGLLRDLRTRAGEGGQGLREHRWPWAVRAVAFGVELSPGEERTLEVSYLQELGVDTQESAWSQLVQLDYILLTARYWEGFRDLELELLAPRGARVESSLPLTLAPDVESQGIDRYTFRSASLPETNLRLAASLPLPTDLGVLRFIGRGSAAGGRLRLVALPAVVLPIVLWVTAARYAARERRRMGL